MKRKNSEISQISEGFFSKVFLDNKSRRVIKRIKVDTVSVEMKLTKDQILEMTKKESKIQMSLKHENILVCYGFKPEPIQIELENIDGYSLEKYLIENKDIDIKKRIDIAINIANGLAYIHSKGIAHGDLKPANIIVSQDARDVKIADFGLAIYTKEDKEFPVQNASYVLMEDENISPLGSDLTQFGLLLKTIFSNFCALINDEASLAKLYSKNKENKDSFTEYFRKKGVQNITKLMKIENIYPKPLVTYVDGTPGKIKEIVELYTNYRSFALDNMLQLKELAIDIYNKVLKFGDDEVSDFNKLPQGNQFKRPEINSSLERIYDLIVSQHNNVDFPYLQKEIRKIQINSYNQECMKGAKSLERLSSKLVDTQDAENILCELKSLGKMP